jgi:ATP-dependent Clp protease protease subunit
MIHQPLGGVRGQASDIEIHAKELMNIKKILNEIMHKHTNQPLKKIEKDSDRNFFMSAKDACKYGIIDEVITKRKSKGDS